MFEKIQPNKIVGSCSEVGKWREKRRRGKGKQKIQQPRVQFPTQFLFFFFLGPAINGLRTKRRRWTQPKYRALGHVKVALFRAYLLTMFRDESAKVTSRKWSRLWEFWCYQNIKKILRFYSQHRFPTNCCWEIVLFSKEKSRRYSVYFYPRIGSMERAFNFVSEITWKLLPRPRPNRFKSTPYKTPCIVSSTTIRHILLDLTVRNEFFPTKHFLFILLKTKTSSVPCKFLAKFFQGTSCVHVFPCFRFAVFCFVLRVCFLFLYLCLFKFA